jgi:hypothetical protein
MEDEVAYIQEESTSDRPRPKILIQAIHNFIQNTDRQIPSFSAFLETRIVA